MILGIGKKKKTDAVKNVKNVKDVGVVKVVGDDETQTSKQAERSNKSSNSNRYNIPTGVLRAPHITEKASQAAGHNQYVFRISERANKTDVRRAVEAKYGVDVQAVNIINLPGKERHRGRQIGWKAGHRKAVVKVKEGQKIEIQ